MSRSCWLILLIVCSTITFADLKALAQQGSLPFTNYALKDYTPPGFSAGTQNWCFEQDTNGVLYVGNGGGVLQFDGVSWRLIPTTNMTTVNALSRDKDGRIWYGAIGEFGFLNADSIGQLHCMPMQKLYPEQFKSIVITDFWEVFITKNGIFFHTTEMVYQFIPDQEKFVFYKPETSFDYSFCVNDVVYVQQNGIGLSKLHNGDVIPLPSGEKYAEDVVYGMLPHKHGMVIGSRESGLKFYDGVGLKSFNTDFDTLLLSAKGYRMLTLKDGNMAIATLKSGLLIMTPEGRLLQRMDRSDGLQDDMVLSLYEDDRNSIWVGLDEGLTRITYPSPLTLYNESRGIDCSIETIARNKGYLYLGTSKGVYYLNEKDPDGKFRLMDSYIQLWNFTFSGDRLFVAATRGVFELIEDRIVPVPLTEDIPLFSLLCPKRSPHLLYLGYKTGVSVVDMRSDKVTRIEGLKASARTMAEDRDGSIWIGTPISGVFRIDKDHQIKGYDTLDGLPKGVIRVHGSDIGVFFTTDFGLYRLDTATDRFVPDSTYGNRFTKPGVDVFRFMKDPYRNEIWFNSAGKIGIVKLINGEIVYDDHVLRNTEEVQVNDFFFEKDNAWIGSQEHLFQYNHNQSRKYDHPFKTIIRKVLTLKDSVLYMGNGSYHARLPYSLNTLTIQFSAPCLESPSATQYSYILEGFDESWSSYSPQTFKQYTNLSEGSYVFKVKARSIYGFESSMAELRIKIDPPYYRTLWAYLLYIGLSALLLYASIQYYTRRLRRKNIILEKIVSDRTAEIEQKKKNLEVAYSEIEIKNKEITDSISYAKRIQEAILQPPSALDQYFSDSFILFLPRDIVSGDFYWFPRHGSKENNRILFAVADCTGHGVPGAFMSMIGNDLITQAVFDQRLNEPSEILKFLDEQLKLVMRQSEQDKDSAEGMDIAIISIDPDERRLKFSSAQRPLIIIRNKELIEVAGSKCSAGGFTESVKQFEQHEINLESGDCIYLFSDGYVDQFGENTGKKFMMKRLREMLIEIAGLSMTEQKARLEKAFLDWKGNTRQMDDVLVAGIKI